MKAFIVFLLICLLGFGYYKLVIVKRKKPVAQKPVVTKPIEIPVAPKPEPEVKPVPPPEKEKPVLKDVYDNYAEALSVAKAYDKSVFLYLGAEWCHWCKVMKAQTLSDSEVQAKLKEFVICIIDTDKSEEGLVGKFKVGGIPDYMIVSNDGTVLIRGSGFKSKYDFINWLHPKNTTILGE